jgi:V8-like Glu-specific endopeptidase
MTDINKLDRFTPEELLQELRARKHAQIAKETRLAGRGKIPKELVSIGIELREDLKATDSATIAQVLRSKQKVIYGVDDRQDIYAISDQAMLNDADSVVSLFRSYNINDNGDGTSTLVTERFQDSYGVCDSEPFKDQPTGAFCSGFLVGPDLIATAGHCVDGYNVTDTLFVFGFRMNDSTTAQTVIDNNEIYRGVSIVGREIGDNGTDWTLVRPARRATNHAIAQIRREGILTDDQAVHVIGHPCGLPLKVAGGAHCRDNTPSAYFVANLDTYGGNSGSPVFNNDTHQVEGILVRGETDFVWTNNCAVSNVCPNTGCRGEDLTNPLIYRTRISN